MASQKPTHAGGVVYRIERGRPEFLLVTARRSPKDWVYPKGHIERGETPEQTAAREVEEESGVNAAIVEPLEDIRLRIRGDDQIIRYFLMRAIKNGAPREGRRSAWLPAKDAIDQLSFAEAQGSLRKAVTLLKSKGLV
jgi:8-oxo-dGTP pyrophosphatase MutT (NUDIX family)